MPGTAMKRSHSSLPTRNSDTLLRAVAITFVVVIHFLSSFKESPFIPGAEYQTLAVTLDQLGRLAVPLFVAISGYGLMQKYQVQEFKWREFVKRRLFQLVPLYVLWSYIYWFVFLFMPEWRPTSDMKPFFGQLLFGNADYHLYFVPMIFQLYLVFPLLLKLTRKHLKVLVAAAALFQLWFYWLISTNIDPQPGTTFFQSDQKQYLWSFTWIFYFVLGMAMPQVLNVLSKKFVLQLVSYFMLVISGFWVAYSALEAINSGTDPLIALRFTRPIVLLYATSAIVFLFMLFRNVKALPAGIAAIGKHSYMIYLSHTLMLRIIFTYFIKP